MKLRELAASYMFTQPFVTRVIPSGVELTLTGRNLFVWTDYSGFDPELNFNGTSNYSTADFLTQPPVRYFTARVSLNW